MHCHFYALFSALLCICAGKKIYTIYTDIFNVWYCEKSISFICVHINRHGCVACFCHASDGRSKGRHLTMRKSTFSNMFLFLSHFSLLRKSSHAHSILDIIHYIKEERNKFAYDGSRRDAVFTTNRISCFEKVENKIWKERKRDRVRVARF